MRIEAEPSAPYRAIGNKTNEVNYDLDVAFVPREFGGIDSKENITSRSLCTPGCGQTGTGNSFCC